MRRLLGIVVAVLFLSTSNAYAETETSLASYTGSEGISIISYSEQWSDMDKLKKLYQVFMENEHGEEMSYISHINIYPGSSPYGSGTAGIYHGSYILGSDGTRSYEKGRYIELFNGDVNTEINQMAKTLAHEYGHHFTMYYLWLKEGKSFNKWQETKWAKVRGIVNDQRVSITGEHQWNPAEIAAEDYVQLFGSDTARQSLPYASQFGSFDSNTFNLAPQENLELPLAYQVSGYLDYWTNMADIKVENNEPPTSPKLALTKVEPSHFQSSKFTLVWEKAFDDKSRQLEYTLVYYEPGETLAAPVITVMNEYQADFICPPSFRDKVLVFRVFVKDEQNALVSSPILLVDVNNPEVKPLGPVRLFKDLDSGHWTYEYVEQLLELGLVTGYSDDTFRPSNAITRGEFTTMLVKTLGLDVDTEKKSSFEDTKSHWAGAYIEAAKIAGLVNGYDGNVFRPNQLVTRGEIAMMLARAVNTTDTLASVEFLDIDGHWAEDSINKIASIGVVGGYENGTFRPNQRASRGETAAMMARMLDFLNSLSQDFLD